MSDTTAASNGQLHDPADSPHRPARQRAPSSRVSRAAVATAASPPAADSSDEPGSPPEERSVPSRAERAALRPVGGPASGPTDPGELDLRATPVPDTTPYLRRAHLWLKTRYEAGRLELELHRRTTDALRRLRTRPDARAVTIAGHSPKGGCGKTTIDKLLAHELASNHGVSVAALDANMDRSNLWRTLGEANRRTIWDVLEHRSAIRRGGLARLRSYATVVDDVAYFVSPRISSQRQAMDPVAMTHVLDLIAAQFDVVIVDNSIGFRDPVVHWSAQSADVLLYLTQPDEDVAAEVVTDIQYVTGRTLGQEYAVDCRHIIRQIEDAWKAGERAADGLPTTPPGVRDPRDVVVVFNESLGPRDPVSIEKFRSYLPGVSAVEPFPKDDTTARMVRNGTLRLDAVPPPTRLATKTILVAVLERLAAHTEGE